MAEKVEQIRQLIYQEAQKIRPVPMDSDLLGVAGQILQLYLARMTQYTKRNIIVYYQNLNMAQATSGSIQKKDLALLKNAINALPYPSLGVDLIIQTGGGEVEAAVDVINLLKQTFKGDVRVFVLQRSMSAGTLIACMAKQIYLGTNGALGPVDSGYRNTDVRAMDVLARFVQLTEKVAQPQDWDDFFRAYPAFRLPSYAKDFAYTNYILQTVLPNMFAGEADANLKIEQVIRKLNNSHCWDDGHNQLLPYSTCKALGLKVVSLSSDSQLYDYVRNIHRTALVAMDLPQYQKLNRLIQSNAQAQFEKF